MDKAYPIKIGSSEYMMSGFGDRLGTPPSARGFNLKAFSLGLKKYETVYQATEENGYAFIIYADGDKKLILKGGQGSDHKETVMAGSKELQDIKSNKYADQDDMTFLRKTCLSGRAWLVNLHNKNYYFVGIWNTAITPSQYDALKEYLAKFPSSVTYIQMGMAGTGASSEFQLVSGFSPKIASEKPKLTKKEKDFVKTAHMRTAELPASYAKALKKLQSMTETPGLKEIVNEVIKESAEQSLIPFQQVAQSTNSVEDFMKKLVGKKLKNLLDATSFARLYVMNKYGIGSSFDNQDIQVLVSNLIESATAFINFRRLDPMGKQRDEHDKIIRSTPEYNEWNKKRSIALKNYFNAQKTGDQFAIDKARKEKDDVMAADPTLVDYRKTMADMEKLVKDFHNSPLTLQDVLPGPDDSDKDKQRWQTVEKNFNKLKDRISMNEISDFETYKKYQEYALKLIAKLEKIKLLGKSKTPASDIVTQSSVDTVLIGLGKQFPKLTAKLKELHKYSFHYSDLVKLHQKGRLDATNWNDSSLNENAEMAQSDVNKIIKYSDELQSMFDVNDNLEDWVKAKLNHACDYVATVRDYLKFYRDEKDAGTPEDQIDEKWSMKYKRSINCSNPKGFGQKAHCRARKLRQAGKHTKSKPVREIYKEVTNQLLKEFNSSMAMGALKQLNNDAKELKSMLQPSTELEDWVKAKLNLAGEYLDDVYHHLDHFGPEGRKLDEVKLAQELEEGWRDWVAAGAIGLGALAGGDNLQAAASKVAGKPAITHHVKKTTVSKDQKASKEDQTALRSSEVKLLGASTADYIANWEGKKNTVYKDSAGKPTIGIGHYLTNTTQDRELFKKLFGDTVNYDKILKGTQSLDDTQIKTLFNVDVKIKEKSAKEKISGFTSLPQYVKNAILSGLYRGDLGPKTIGHINSGNWDKASIEYLNHQNAKSGPDQIQRRMKTGALAFAHHAKTKNEYFGFNYAIG